MHGAQIARVALRQRCREQSTFQQLLRPVNIGHHALQHPCALDHALFDALPVILCQEAGKQIQSPRALRAIDAVSISVDVVGHAIAVDLLLQVRNALVQLLEARHP